MKTIFIVLLFSIAVGFYCQAAENPDSEISDSGLPAQQEPSMKTVLGFSYTGYFYLNHMETNIPLKIDTSQNYALSFHMGFDLWKDFKFLLNSAFNFQENANLLSNVAGALGWQNALVRVSTQRLAGKYKSCDLASKFDEFYAPWYDESNPNDFSRSSFKGNVFTFNIMYDVFSLPFEYFRERDWAGAFLGLTYFSYTLPHVKVSTGVTSGKEFGFADPKTTYRSFGASIWWDSIMAYQLYDSGFAQYKTENFIIMPWVSGYFSLTFGVAKYSDEAFKLMKAKFSNSEQDTFTLNLLVDAVLGVGVLHEREIMNKKVEFSLGAGFAVWFNWGGFAAYESPGITVKLGAAF